VTAGRPGPHDHRHLRHVDELARGAHRGFRVGLVVLDGKLDLPADDAARPVHLGRDRLHGLEHARPVEAARAGERREHAEREGRALRAQQRRRSETRRRDRKPLQRASA
jgi:hypothetical protein